MELQDLTGEELSSICFVRDYVELHFDGPILRCLADPVVEIPGASWVHPEDGSRDALCQLIGRVIQSTKDDEEQLRIHFEDNYVLVIPKSSEVAGAEVAHLVPFVNGRWDLEPMMIWENLRLT